MRVLIFTLLVMACGAAAFAQEKPIVRAEVKPGTVIVGESAELTITVLVPTWFTRPSVYPTFELANAMTRLPADNSYPIRERIGNESWSGIVRTYEVYPLLGATYRMTGQKMSVTFANPGSDPITTEIELPEVVLRGVVPDGAESLDPYIAGRSLELSVDIEGELDDLEAGDAIVLSYRAELDGLPAIFLPPLAPELEFEGVSVYRDTPDVYDEETARREEKITLVFDAGGEVTIPGLELSFWNTDSQSVETVVAEGTVLSVQGPLVSPVSTEKVAGNRWRQIALLAGSAVALVIGTWRGIPALLRRRRDALERRRQTERYAFAQLRQALNNNDSALAYRALLHWIERLAPGMDVRRFASEYGSETLSATIAALSAGIYGNAEVPSDLRRVGGELSAARKRYLYAASGRKARLLPSLNP